MHLHAISSEPLAVERLASAAKSLLEVKEQKKEYCSGQEAPLSSDRQVASGALAETLDTWRQPTHTS